MINPHASYIISFSISLGLYSLGWSSLYPPLTRHLLGFLLLTILLHGIMAFWWRSKSFSLPRPNFSYFSPLGTTIFIYILWLADFVYEGGIPLIKILFNQPYNYRLFGIPSLHVFTVTFGSFFTIYLFSLYLSTRQRFHLVLYLVNLLAAILIYSRAMMTFNLVGSLFVYLLGVPKFTWKKIAVGMVVFIGLTYGFGMLGTLRVSFEAKSPYDPGLFLDIGEATPSFRASSVPQEFFWGYTYLSSPLANLQLNINTFQVPPFTLRRMAEHFNNEMIFDFISKRVNRLWGIERETEHIIPYKPFNVSTVYSRSFSYQGWAGMLIMAVFVLVLPWIYIRILPVNPYSLTGLAIFNTMYLFLMYDNTIRFTGLGLQLVYPFVLPAAEKASTWFQNKLR
jgi:hypothetical protein